MFIPERDDKGRMLIRTNKPEGNFSTSITHNFCDNTTWPATNDSEWTLTPSEGKKIDLHKAEIQFNHDLQMESNAVVLEYFGWHPSSPGTPILFETVTFDSLYKMFEYGNTHSHCPAIGTELPNGLTTIHFNYSKELVFYGDYTDLKLAYLRATVSGHNELTGSYCTAGFVSSEEGING